MSHDCHVCLRCVNLTTKQNKVSPSNETNAQGQCRFTSFWSCSSLPRSPSLLPPSLTHSHPPSLLHSPSPSLTHSLTPTLLPSLTPPLPPSLTHSHLPSLARSPFPSLTLLPSSLPPPSHYSSEVLRLREELSQCKQQCSQRLSEIQARPHITSLTLEL